MNNATIYTTGPKGGLRRVASLSEAMYGRKPFMETKKGVLFQADTMDFLRGLGSSSVDLIVGELPSAASQGEFAQSSYESIFYEFQRVLKSDGTVLIKAPMKDGADLIKASAGIVPFRYEYIWTRPDPTYWISRTFHRTKSVFVNCLRCSRGQIGPERTHELIFVFSLGKIKPCILGCLSNKPEAGSSVIKISSARGLFSYLIRMFTGPGATIVCPWIGSGAAAYAAEETNLTWQASSPDRQILSQIRTIIRQTQKGELKDVQ